MLYDLRAYVVSRGRSLADLIDAASVSTRLPGRLLRGCGARLTKKIALGTKLP